MAFPGFNTDALEVLSPQPEANQLCYLFCPKIYGPRTQFCFFFLADVSTGKMLWQLAVWCTAYILKLSKLGGDGLNWARHVA